MTYAVVSGFRTVVARRIEASHMMLASRWLEQLKRLVPVEPSEIFPGEQLLGHAPTLVRELAAFLEAPAAEAISSNAVVTARAAEIGRLRHAQQASVHQVLREYRTLRIVIAAFIEEEIAYRNLVPASNDLIELMNRLEAAVDVLLQTTVDTFVTEYTTAIRGYATELEGFNRMVTHELRQPLGTLQFALKMLGTEDTWSEQSKRDRILATAERNVSRINETLSKLLALSRSADGAARAHVQQIELSSVVNEVIADLHEMAEARGVDIRLVPPLPVLTIDVARLELVLVNLLSNAIKYSDPEKPERFVEIASAPGSQSVTCTIIVRDNGLGVAETDLRSIFSRFYRGHAERDPELGTSGLGLGLSIVADCVDALKGDLRVESTLGEGTTFFLDLPLKSEG